MAGAAQTAKDLPFEVKTYYVYMMTNRSRVVLYTGVTNSLERRLWHHQNTEKNTFTKRYKIDRIVYFECFSHTRDAISREKEIKGWRREKKNALVEKLHPRWEDLGTKMFWLRSPDYRPARDDG